MHKTSLEVDAVTITPFAPEAMDEVCAFILSIQNGEFKVGVTLQDQPDLADVAGFFQNGVGNFWTARVDNKIVGTIGVKDFGQKRLALRKMFVHRDYRGSGVAQNLLDTALAWSHMRGVTAIYLGTVAVLLAAHRFYEKQGFEEIAREDLPPGFPLMYVDTKFYYKSLAG